MTLIRNKTSKDQCAIGVGPAPLPCANLPPLVSVEEDDDDGPPPLISDKEERHLCYRKYLYVLCQGYVGPFDGDFEVHGGVQTCLPDFGVDWGVRSAFAKEFRAVIERSMEDL